ncbi:MAG TPA: pro-sigmaK processing inhibitor BofA family protein [Calditerricola sp.]|nr:pro-sigmaK processing inhibitor BofA family protein [Calditerricola satsumensis]
MKEWGWALLAGLVAVLLVQARSFFTPLRWIGYAVVHVVVGALVIYFFNLFAEMADFRLPINPLTALVVGFGGVPGLVALVLLKGWFV